MKVSYNRIRSAAVIYVAIPIFIFFIGWLSALWAAVFSVLLAAACFFFWKSSRKQDGEKLYAVVSKKTLIIIGAIALAWCFLAGHGGFFHQSDDNAIRNAIFRDLIKLPWPVVYSDGSMLSYYIAHWMPPALAGKIFYAVSGSAAAGYAAGNVFLLLWSSIGVYLSLLLVVILTFSRKKPRILLAVFMFILFSGLDVIGTAVTGYMYSYGHLEWWATEIQYSSFTTCLFWVYNQTIAIWLVTLCIINERSVKIFAFLGLLALPFGPLPFIGIVLLCIIKAAVIGVKAIRKGKLAAAVKNIFSPQNILACVSVFPVYYLYYFSNAIAANDAYFAEGKKEVGFRINEIWLKPFAEGDVPDIISKFLLYILFVLLEAGVYAAIILIHLKSKKKKAAPEFKGALFILLLLPLFRLGSGGDFTMRVSIPFIVYLAVEMIKAFADSVPAKGEIRGIEELVKKKTLFFVSSIIFLLGAITPAFEFYREIRYTVTNFQTPHDLEETESMDEIEIKNNFIARDYTESNFYKFISKK
ncbi:MAG: hypothetical protein K2J77_06390 [Oscillospiraceae bacterium]|nr:hypothetical protein [Oscillospiraceae bacterium]